MSEVLTKICTICKVGKTLDNFSPQQRKGRSNVSPFSATKAWCKPCYAALNRTKYKKTASYRAAQRGHSKRSYHNLKAEVIAAYGGTCICCGEHRPQFLTVDHIDGNGAEMRKQGIHGLGGNLYGYLKRMNFPRNEFQLLCFNCNCAKRLGEVCPHKVIQEDIYKLVELATNFHFK
jgi:hypothetical protein